MSNENEDLAPDAESTQDQVSEDVVQELNALAAQLEAMKRAADRSWKLAAIVYAALIIIVAGYLFGFVYAKGLKPVAEPQNLVDMTFSTFSTALEGQGLPGLENPDALANRLGEELKQQAPTIVQQQLRPVVEQMLADLPQHRRQLAADLKAKAPDLTEQALETLTRELLPQLRHAVVRAVVDVTKQTLDDLDQQMAVLTDELLEEHMRSMAVLDTTSPEKLAEFRQAIEDQFEQSAGYLLDEVFEGINEGVNSTLQGTTELARAYRQGNLTHEQKLHLTLIRLVHDLFAMKAEQEGVEPIEPAILGRPLNTPRGQ